MNGTLVGARARARAEVRREILASASRQIALAGASSLSLRAVSRELGMVPSALYRYFKSRDELLTALIVEAYDSLGAHTERSVSASRDKSGLDRWVGAASAVRSWAIAHPHDYALLYGSPVPGYAAPVATVDPGTRVTRALIRIVHDASAARRLKPAKSSLSVELTEPTRTACALLRAQLDLDLDDGVVVSVILAWTQLFGLLSFELFGQTKGLIDDHEAFFREAATIMGGNIGLR